MNPIYELENIHRELISLESSLNLEKSTEGLWAKRIYRKLTFQSPKISPEILKKKITQIAKQLDDLFFVHSIQNTGVEANQIIQYIIKSKDNQSKFKQLISKMQELSEKAKISSSIDLTEFARDFLKMSSRIKRKMNSPFSKISSLVERLANARSISFSSSEATSLFQEISEIIVKKGRVFLKDIAKFPEHIEIWDKLRDLIPKDKQSAMTTSLEVIDEFLSDIQDVYKPDPLGTAMRQEMNKYNLCISQGHLDSPSTTLFKMNESEALFKVGHEVVFPEHISQSFLRTLSEEEIADLIESTYVHNLPHLRAYIDDKLPESRTFDGVQLSFARGYDRKNLSLYKRNLKEGARITFDMLKTCIYYQNYPLIELIASSDSGKQLISENAEEILALLAKTRDSYLTHYFFKHFPELGENCSTKIIHKVISIGNTDFLEQALQRAKQLSRDQFHSLLNTALESYNLQSIQTLLDYARQYEIGSFSMEELLQIKNLKGEKNSEKRFHFLFKYALFSPMNHVHALAVKPPFTQREVQRVEDMVSLLVRFPSFQFAKDMSKASSAKFEDMDTYFLRSLQYAQQNKELIQRISPSLKKMTRGELWDLITADRAARLPKKEREDYLRSASKESEKIDWLFLTPLVYGEIFSRYYPSLKLLTGRLYEHKSKNWGSLKDIPGIEKDKNSLVFTYFTEKTGSLPMTTFDVRSLTWQHTPKSTIIRLQSHLEDLQKEILNYPLIKGSPESESRFSEMLARGYWLVSTLCETARGTPHNALIWLNCMCRHHGFRLIPNQDNFFLDNTALMRTLPDFINHWHACFESNLRP